MKANGATRSPHALPVVILGTDAALAAAPATPVQLAHACLRAGFASVIPANWGDELVAASVVRRLAEHGSGPAIQCSCPIVAHRLLTVSGDLRHVLVPLVAPPVAVARYVRALSQPGATRITYVGACPGALDESIDIRMTPAALLELLAERQIVPEDQPRMFESVLPPDRRRYWSQPGGLPSPDVLWRAPNTRTLVEITSEDIPSEVAQHLLSGKSVLIDASARLGCVCSGAGHDVPPLEARGFVTALEPPRATSPIIEERPDIELYLPVPAASRTPVDVIAVVEASANSSQPAAPDAAPAVSPQPMPTSPVRGIPIAVEPRPARAVGPAASPRPVLGGVPVARDVEGRTLPRAYVARRRPSPRSNPVVPPAPAGSAHAPLRVPAPARPMPPRAEVSASPRSTVPTSARVVGLAAVAEERPVPLAATTEPAPAPLAAGPFANPLGPPGAPAAAAVVTPSPQPTLSDFADASNRASRPARDPAAADNYLGLAEEARRALRRRLGLTLLWLATVVVSAATGAFVASRVVTSPAPSAATP